MKGVYVYITGDPTDGHGDQPVIARSEFPGEAVTIDYDHDGGIFGVEVIDAGWVEVYHDTMAGEGRSRGENAMERVEHLEHAIYDALKLLPLTEQNQTTAAILRGQLPQHLQESAERHRGG